MKYLDIEYRDMLDKDYICPLCNSKFLCTQCGPNNSPKLTWLMQKLPSAKIFKKFCRIHDILYNIVPEKSIIVRDVPVVGSFLIDKGDRKSCDDLFFILLKNYVKSLRFFKRIIYGRAANLYYKAVRECGEDSFIHNHNKGI